MKQIPTVEVHSWSRDQYEITPWIKSLSVSGATVTPWSSITASMRIPAALWTRLAPRQGEWLVVRGKDGKAIGWGYVHHRTGGVRVRGQSVVTDDTEVSTLDWLDLAERIEVYVAPGLVVREGVASQRRTGKRANRGVLPSEPGTLLPIQRWTDPDTGPWRALVKAARNYFEDEQGREHFRPIGFALQEFVKAIMRVLVPPSLASEYLASQVRTVYDESGVAAYAPDREAEVVPGYSLAGIGAIQPTGSSITSMIMQTFMADLNLVELFTSLEGPGVVESSNDPVDRKLRQKPESKADEVYVPAYDIDAGPYIPTAGLELRSQGGEVEERTETTPDITDEERYGRKLASGLAQNLGRNPVLIYRMRPWRALPLDKFIAETVGTTDQKTLVQTEDGIVEATRPANRLGTDKFNVDQFPGTTWRYDDALQIDRSSLINLDFAVDDSEHANVVTVGLPTQADSPIRFMQRLGLPFFSDTAILTRGVRLFQPQWPFFPPVDNRKGAATAKAVLGPVAGSAVAGEIARSGSLLRDMRTIALLGMQYMAGADRFEQGHAMFEYIPQIRHGEPLRIGMPENAPGGTKELVVYVERWTHTWDVRPPTNVVARTVVQFSRGLFDEEVRSKPIVYTGPGGVS
jgi:hypothetical protein